MDWEFTANHYLALPAISAASGAIHGATVLHRGMACQLCWSGSPDASLEGSPLLRPVVTVDGEEQPLKVLRVERLDRWIPRLSCETRSGMRVVLTYCTPGGFDPLVRGGLIVVHIENGAADADVGIALEAHWQFTLRTVATTRPVLARNRLIRAATAPGVVLEAGEMPHGAALAIVASAPAGIELNGEGARWSALAPGEEREALQGEALRFRLRTERRVGGGKRWTTAFHLGVAPDRDGAMATATRLMSLGAETLVRKARLDLASLNRATDESVARDLVARNLVFHHYFGAARAIDDDRLYPVPSRSPVHGASAVFDERAALAWSLPAYTLTDPMLARELLLHMLEVWSDRAGLLRRYMDGTVLDGSFSLGRVCEYGIAIERYVEQSRDAHFVEEPLVQQVLRELDEMCWERLHPEVFLAGTEVLSSGEPADHPYCSFDNVLLWRLCRILARHWPGGDASPSDSVAPPRLRHGDEEVEAAFWKRFTTEVDGLPVIAYTSDLRGHAAVYDDPAGSLRWLPFLGFCAEDDPIWSNTMELLHSPSYPLWLGRGRIPGLAGRSHPAEASFAALCADLLGSQRANALDRLRAIDLPGGVACATWDPETGRAASGPYAAALAGLLVWALLEHHATPAERREKGK
jgi:hypothetical protein